MAVVVAEEWAAEWEQAWEPGLESEWADTFQARTIINTPDLK